MLKTHYCFQHFPGHQHPGLGVFLKPCLSSCTAFRTDRSRTAPLCLCHWSCRIYYTFSITSRFNASVLGVSRDSVSLLSVWLKTEGQFLSSLQVHVLHLFRSALEGTADHSWRRGPPQPLSPTPALKFFLPCHLSFSTASVRTAPRDQPHLETLLLPFPASAPSARTAPRCRLRWDFGSDALPSRGRLSRPALRSLPSSGAWRPRGSKKG